MRRIDVDDDAGREEGRMTSEREVEGRRKRAIRRDTEHAETSGARRDARGGEGMSSRTGRGSGLEGDVHGVCYRNS